MYSNSKAALIRKSLWYTTITVLAMLLFCAPLRAQDVNFSQHYNSPTYYNPAFTGLTTGLKARLNYRKHWTGLNGTYRTYNFSADIADRNLPGAGGIGIIASSDVQGVGMINSTVFGIMPAVRIPITRNSIFQLGALASIVTRQINMDNLVFQDQLDPRWGNIYQTVFSGTSRDKVTFPDFSFGGIYQFKGYNVDGSIGAAVHHITQPNQSFFEESAPLPRKYVFHTDFVISIAENQGYYNKRQGFKLNPGMIAQYQNGLFLYSVGLNVYMSHVYLGLWYRNEALEYDNYSNFIVMAGLNINFNETSRMKIMYSYDLNVTAKHNFTGPSHEIGLIFEFDEISFSRKTEVRGIRSTPSGPIECSPF